MAEASAGGVREASPSDARSEPQASEAASWCDVPVELPPPGRMAVFEADGLRLVLCNAEGVA
ncbi:MAG: hypothetical protein ACREI8_09625, partial [Myxococcota bacterium]